MPKQAGEARTRDGERILIFAVCTRIGYNLNCNISTVMQLFHLDAAFRFLLHFVSQLSSSATIDDAIDAFEGVFDVLHECEEVFVT